LDLERKLVAGWHTTGVWLWWFLCWLCIRYRL